jgi:hypothetical protein
MSKSGGSQTVTTQIDPTIKAAYLQNLQQAQGVASALPVKEFADFNPIYRAGEQQMVNTGLAGRGIDTTNIAAEYANQAAQFNPYYVGGVNAGMSNQFGAVGYTPTAATAAQSNMSNISNYMNPYTNQVITNNLSDIESARQAAVQQMGEAATRAKAYGGSRQGVAEAATNRAYADKAAQMSAQLRQQGFDTSANLMQQDLARQQQANLQTAAQGTGAAQYGAGAINAAMGGNAAAQNAMAQFNAQLAQQSDLANQQAYAAANAQRLGAAGQLGALGAQQQNLGLGGAQAVMGVGSAQQQMTQAQLDALRGIGLEKLGITQQAMSTALPNAGGSTTSPTYKNPLSSALGGAGYGYTLGALPGMTAIGGPAGAAIGGLLGLLGG